MRSALIGAAAVSLAISILPAAHAQGPAGTPVPPTRSTESAPSEAARQFVEKAAIGDMFEIQSSQLALERSRDEAVKAFAQMMVDDHRRLSAQMKQTLQPPNQGVAVPDRLDAKHREMMERLRAAEGAEFDRLYLQMQLAAHEEALALHNRYAAEGDHQELRSLAESAGPIVAGHLDRLRGITAGR